MMNKDIQTLREELEQANRHAFSAPALSQIHIDAALLILDKEREGRPTFTDNELVSVANKGAHAILAQLKIWRDNGYLSPPKEEALTDEMLERAAFEVVEAAWNKANMMQGVHLLFEYLRMWRERGGIAFVANPLPAPPSIALGGLSAQSEGPSEQRGAKEADGVIAGTPKPDPEEVDREKGEVIEAGNAMARWMRTEPYGTPERAFTHQMERAPLLAAWDAALSNAPRTEEKQG